MRQFHHPDGDLTSSGPTGDLRARMSARDDGDARPGIGELQKNAAQVLSGQNDVSVNGVRYRRDALGGVSMSTGPDLRAALTAKPPAPDVAPEVSPSVAPAEPKPVIGDPIAALTAHLPATARRAAQNPQSSPDADTEALARAMLAKITGVAP